MEVINNYDKAVFIAKPYIEHLKKSAQLHYDNGSSIKLPEQIKWSKWKLSLQALQNTLKYIFKKLHHSCYMLCINNDHFVIYKLEVLDASPTFENAINTIHLPKLEKNDMVTSKQKDYIRQQLSEKEVRVMQCILKTQYKDNKGAKLQYNDYQAVLSDLKLPNGVFILNLTDAVILRTNGKEPFPMVTGDLPLDNFHFQEHIPIFSMSGKQGYGDIPIPNYDDIAYLDSEKTQVFAKFHSDWDSKTISKAVFRGGPSGCGYTTETNMRLKLAGMKAEYLDVGVTTGMNKKTIDSLSIKFDPIYGIGMLNTGMPPASFISMVDQSQYKYIIHIDGNVNAYRLLTTMRTGSLLLRVKSEYTSWIDHLIQPQIHYLEIAADLSDLDKCIKYCLKHEEYCKKIASKGLEVATMVLQTEFIKSYVQKLLWSVSNYQDIEHSTNKSVIAPSSNRKSSSFLDHVENITKKYKLKYKRATNKFSITRKSYSPCPPGTRPLCGTGSCIGKEGILQSSSKLKSNKLKSKSRSPSQSPSYSPSLNPKMDFTSSAFINTIPNIKKKYYTEDIVFAFFAKSADAKPGRGKAGGEKMIPERSKEFKSLENCQFRQKLSTFWIQPFELNGKRWATVEHYYQGSKFKINNPSFYDEFSLDSNSELANDPNMANSAGSLTGKHEKKQLRPKSISIDPDFIKTNRPMEELYLAQYAKFTQHPELRKVLIDTKDAKLVHIKSRTTETFDALMVIRDLMQRNAI